LSKSKINRKENRIHLVRQIIMEKPLLTITEDLFLLTLYERKNSIVPSAVESMPYALIGAMFVDLISTGKVRLHEEKRILLVDATPTGNRYLDMMLEAIQIPAKAKKLTYWITVFGSRYKRLQRYLFDSLIEKRLLTMVDEQYVWVISGLEEPHPAASAKFQRKQHLREIVLGGKTPDAQSINLLCLLDSFGLLDSLFTHDEIKAAGRKLRDLFKIEENASPLFGQIDEISTAAAIASAMGEPV
jgi:hypothetical protein